MAARILPDVQAVADRWGIAWHRAGPGPAQTGPHEQPATR